jgi:transketolase
MLGLYKKANAGHIGSSLSCLDILIYLFFHKMKKNDKLILSKGHAAGALYTVLSKKGDIPEAVLDTFCKDGTFLPAHPAAGNKIKGITFATGSLGHGLSLSCGMALSARFTRKKFRVYCILSDGDCNEGSTWEAALFAAQQKLGNLTVIIDNNGLQAFGFTKDVLNLEPLMEKWKTFNFKVVYASNGNSFQNLDKAFSHADSSSLSLPRCVIAKTVKGSGVSFMENRMEWHYLPMSDELYAKALSEIERKYA